MLNIKDLLIAGLFIYIIVMNIFIAIIILSVCDIIDPLGQQ